jgi:hypothetical protein
MRRILGAIGVTLAIGALSGFAIAGIGGDGTQTYQAAVDSSLQGASVELEVSDDASTLVAERLPDPPPGEVYMAWIKRPGSDSPEPSVVFLPRDGSATVQALASGNVDEVLVTREPSARSQTPSEEPVIEIQMSRS